MDLKELWRSCWNGTLDAMTRANDQMCLENPDWDYVLRQLGRMETWRRAMINAIDVHKDELENM